MPTELGPMCRFIESVDMYEHFTQLRRDLQWTTDAELDQFLSAVIKSFSDIVEVTTLVMFCHCFSDKQSVRLLTRRCRGPDSATSGQ